MPCNLDARAVGEFHVDKDKVDGAAAVDNPYCRGNTVDRRDDRIPGFGKEIFRIERDERFILDNEEIGNPSLFSTEQHAILPLRIAVPVHSLGRRMPAEIFSQPIGLAAISVPMAETAPPNGDRIAKLLARAGIASRREVERMIAEGRIALDGQVLDTPATVLHSLDGVTVDGKPVAAPDAARLFLYHKPPGLLVTERDPGGRPTIYDRMPSDLPRVVPVGRLDLNTEGLLLLTTDGGLKRTLELPATGVERSYRARAYGPVTQNRLEALIEGIEIDGVRYGSIDANLERRTGANVWIELTLTEGKNREVRRVLEHLGLKVSRLIRTRYGPFVLADIPAGAIGEVAARDLTAFTNMLGSSRGRGNGDQRRISVSEASLPSRNAVPKRTSEAPAVNRRTTERVPRSENMIAKARMNSRAGASSQPARSDTTRRTGRPAKGPAGGRGHPPRGKR